MKLTLLALGLCLAASPAGAEGGRATCAGKTFEGITYATIDSAGQFAVISLWGGKVTDADAAKRTAPRFTIVLNGDMSCEMQDVFLHHRFGTGD